MFFFLNSRTPGSRQSSPAEQQVFADTQSNQVPTTKPSTPVKPLVKPDANDQILMDSLESTNFDNFPINYGNALQNDMVVSASSYFNGQTVQMVASQRSQQQIAMAAQQQQQQQQQLGMQSTAYPGNSYFITASPTPDPYGGVPMATVPSPAQAQQVVHPPYQATYNAVPWGVYQPSNTGQFAVQQQQAQLLRATPSSGRPAGNEVIPQQVRE